MTRYKVVLTPAVLREIDQLPGHMRARVRRAIVALQEEPLLPQTRPLSFDLPPTQELLRSRLDDWRLVYLVNRETREVFVLAVRRRPPYSYGDLASLLEDAG